MLSHGRSRLRAPVHGRPSQIAWLDPHTLVYFVGPVRRKQTRIPGGRAKRLRDEAAGSAAARAARSALLDRFGLESGFTCSHAHSEGRAVAIASMRPGRIGVDLVRVSRVTVRALAAIATSSEATILSRLGSLAPAAAWAIKEASVKAFGDVRGLGMTQIRITQSHGRLLAGPVDQGFLDPGPSRLAVRMWRSGDWLIAGVAPDRIGSGFP